METMKEPPVFDPNKRRSDYPLSGRQTGPAWRTAWELLWWQEPETYVDAVELSAEVSRRTGVNQNTVRNLLISAHRANILEATTRLAGGRNRTHYRIAREYR